MNLLQIETFLAVARSASFTKAGAIVHLSQSAVSRQIQDLEKSLGVRLFERFGGRVFLTTAGRTLLEDAPRLLRQVESMRARLRDIAQGQAGDLRLGVTVSVANTFLPRVLVRFREASAAVNLSLVIDHTPGLVEKLRNNEIDLAIIGSAVEPVDLTVCGRVRDELVLVAAPAHRLAGKKALRAEHLSGVEFIFRESGSDSRALVEEWLEKRGVVVKTLMALW
jgi:DNA-binding transcriptional LysR family regulator